MTALEVRSKCPKDLPLARCFFRPAGGTQDNGIVALCAVGHACMMQQPSVPRAQHGLPRKDIPHAFVCPLSAKLMHDAVRAINTISVSKQAIGPVTFCWRREVMIRPTDVLRVDLFAASLAIPGGPSMPPELTPEHGLKYGMRGAPAARSSLSPVRQAAPNKVRVKLKQDRA